MKSIATLLYNNKSIIDDIDKFVEKYIGTSLLRRCNIAKIKDKVAEGSKGLIEYADTPLSRLLGSNVEESKLVSRCISAGQILKDKLVMSFIGVSAYKLFSNHDFWGDYEKDTFYRFDRLQSANWERLQLETAHNIIEEVAGKVDPNCTWCLVFDDSLYQRTSGKGTELCGIVHDHTDNKNRIGYRMMTGGITNGDIYIPFAQTLLATRDKNLMIGPDESYDKRTISGKRKARAKEKGTDTVERMVAEAQNAGFSFEYVLFDTWFSNPAQLITLKNMGTNVIAMIKKNSTKYTCVDPTDGEEKNLDVKEIFTRYKKRPGKSRYLLSVEVTVTNQDGESIPARLVYARNHSNRKDWVCFVCTNIELSEEDVLHLYMFRWKTELYFKVSKAYLKLRTECHSTSYDAITSHMVIVALRYMMLALQRFNATDDRSIEQLFYEAQREVVGYMMECSVVTIIDILLGTVKDYFKATKEQMIELTCIFINELPINWKCRFKSPLECPDFA